MITKKISFFLAASFPMFSESFFFTSKLFCKKILHSRNFPHKSLRETFLRIHFCSLLFFCKRRRHCCITLPRGVLHGKTSWSKKTSANWEEDDATRNRISRAAVEQRKFFREIGRLNVSVKNALQPRVFIFFSALFIKWAKTRISWKRMQLSNKLVLK